jgi:hypothetical protein
MIKETFAALKNIGVSDDRILDFIVAMEARHEEHRHNFDLMREDMHGMKRDISVLKWVAGSSVPVFLGLLITILFKVFAK